MFGLFKKKEPSVPVNDIIFMNTAGKQQYLLSLAAQYNHVFVCWFEKTADTLQQFFENNGITRFNIIQPREAGAHRNTELIFCEHHPSLKIEQQRFLQLGLEKVTVVSALDEALLKKFGGENIAAMMQKLGMKEDEPVTHKLVTKSIQNAQKKTDAQFNGIEGHAHSQEEWMNRLGSFL